MAYWLLTIILAYLFFSISSLADKLVLAGPPRPKSYTFYIGILNGLAILALPCINFELPNINSLPFMALGATSSLAGLYFMFVALEKFDVSRVVPTIGAIQPIFIFILASMLWGFELLKGKNFLAFIFLLAGSIIISIEKKGRISKGYFKVALFASLMFSLEYVFSKIVFLNEPFLKGFVWMRIFVFLSALLFLFGQNSIKEIFKKRNALDKKTRSIFFCGQAAGGIANALQSFSIFLVPAAFLPIINSLRGVQYVFLFLMVIFLSYFYPKILKEKMSEFSIIKKIISIFFIILGLVILNF